ncbi:hypothetical protein RchiOBHm_Chr4g0386871 [Rosa chinensis]|uniref:Uncharacterized protein n=1 Tax=Rosa chinensis TaxID=74649 RepID=A0A2P6QPA1_ROSCH|nr:hypothetical protein RchiOBHm_Chr4g0386871 [Rosa chinensis]
MEQTTIITMNKSSRSNQSLQNDTALRSNHQCLPSPITLHLHPHPPQIRSSRLLIGKQILIFFPICCRLSRILILPHQPLHSSTNNICHVLSETSCYFQGGL